MKFTKKNLKKWQKKASSFFVVRLLMSLPLIFWECEGIDKKVSKKWRMLLCRVKDFADILMNFLEQKWKNKILTNKSIGFPNDA